MAKIIRNVQEQKDYRAKKGRKKKKAKPAAKPAKKQKLTESEKMRKSINRAVRQSRTVYDETEAHIYSDKLTDKKGKPIRQRAGPSKQAGGKRISVTNPIKASKALTPKNRAKLDRVVTRPKSTTSPALKKLIQKGSPRARAAGAAIGAAKSAIGWIKKGEKS